MLSQLSIGLSKVDQFNFEGVSMMLRGRYAEAENCFIKALAFSPDDGNIKSDVNGSYTGVPLNRNEKPVQDADDL